MNLSYRKFSRLFEKKSRRSVAILMLAVILGGFVTMVGSVLVPSGEAWAISDGRMIAKVETPENTGTEWDCYRVQFSQNGNTYHSNSVCRDASENIKVVNNGSDNGTGTAFNLFEIRDYHYDGPNSPAVSSVCPIAQLIPTGRPAVCKPVAGFNPSGQVLSDMLKEQCGGATCEWGNSASNLNMRLMIGGTEQVSEAQAAEGQTVVPVEDPNANAGRPEETVDENVCYDGSGPIGWIICPIITGISGVGNWMWDEIENNFLQIRASELFKEGSGIQIAWSIVRNIANVVFIILFLVVIFSQVTGVGINNYGIKKIMPKLIVVAILVNLSYIICELAVDLSNIIGAGVNNLLSGAADQVAQSASVQTSGASAAAFAIDTLLAGGGVAIFALITGPAFLAEVAALGLAVLGIVFTVVASIIVLFLILIIREAGIVLLVAIAPIAIVCYLLPNTEKMSKKWFDLFKALLVVYPICGAIVGTGKLAGMVLASVNVPAMKVAALIVQVLPFFLIPMLLKGSLSMMGNVGAKLSGVGKSLGAKAGNTARGTIGNSDRFKDWQKWQQDEKALYRAHRIADKYGIRNNLTERQRAQLLNAQKAINADTAAKAEAEVGAYELDSALAQSRAQSAKDAQELKAYQDQFAGFDQAQLRAEAGSAANWLGEEGASQRMSALLQTMEAQGMDGDIATLLANNDMSGMAGVRQTLAGSKNAIFSAYGKRASRTDNNGNVSNVDFRSFMTGTGPQSLQSYFNDKGGDAVSKLDDKSLATIAQYQSQTGEQIMQTNQLVQAAAQMGGEDSLRSINEMLRSRDDINLSGEQLARLKESTTKELLQTNAGRRALLGASDQEISLDLKNRMRPEVRRGINTLRANRADGGNTSAI